MVKELDLLVHTLATYPDLNNPIKMEVGIEECLHIEFEYNKSKWEAYIFVIFFHAYGLLAREVAEVGQTEQKLSSKPWEGHSLKSRCPIKLFSFVTNVSLMSKFF